MFQVLFWLAEVPAPLGLSVSADAILPILALVVGVAIGVIRAYSMSRDAAYDIQYNAAARRLKQCEESCDVIRAERDGYREELADAHVRIDELEARYERRPDAGP